MPQIHPTAIIDDQATLAEDVVVGPNCIVEGPVTLGPGTKLMAQCYLKGPLTLGENNTVYPFATIGLEAQDWKADPTHTGPGTVIGDGNVFRESVSIPTTTDGMAQDRFGAKQRKQLSGHEGAETDHFTGADLHPFGMGSGQTDDTVPTRILSEEARNLGFFAPHYVCWFVLFEAAHHLDPQAWIRV